MTYVPKCTRWPCQNLATVWVEWETTGRPKGTYLCDEHLDTSPLPSGRPRYTVIEHV